MDDAAVWRVHRKLIEPAFNSAIIKLFLTVFHEKTMICMDKLDSLAGGAEFNIGPVWSRLTLDNILSTSFGTNTNVQVNEDDETLKLVNR
jgi:cytochrome P450